MTEKPGFFEGTGMPDPGWWEALWSDPAGVLACVGIKSGMDLVDLCSGDGWFTLQIAKIVRTVTAIDIDGKLLDVARRRLMENGVLNCTYIERDAYEIAGVVLRLSLAVKAVLKIGGRFAIVNWHRRPREETIVLGEPRGPNTELRITPETTKVRVEPSGLSFLGMVEIPPYHYGCIFERSAK